jgi:hypothetical protein
MRAPQIGAELGGFHIKSGSPPFRGTALRNYSTGFSVRGAKVWAPFWRTAPQRHSCESGNPWRVSVEAPHFAGMVSRLRSFDFFTRSKVRMRGYDGLQLKYDRRVISNA